MEFKRYFYTNYYVSKCGNVKSIINEKQKLLNNTNGIIEYYENGKKIKLKVHRMVKICWDFKINYLYLKVKHLDNNKNNNNLENLQWI
jgi:hypothetical protein